MDSSSDTIMVLAPTPEKRKQPNSQNLDHERVIKRRAAKACQSCRSRKVRCDTMINGTCCTNCKLDGIECIVPTSYRGKTDGGNKQSGENQAKSRSPNLTSSTLDPPIQAAMNPRAQTQDETVYLSPKSCEIGPGESDIPVCLTFDDNDIDTRTETEPELASGRDKVEQHQQCFSSSSGSDPHTSPGVSLFATFTKSFSDSIDADDVEYLRKKGALTVPTENVRVEILRAYMLGVHPFMPILDLKDFLHIVSGKGGDAKVSLLLFQAVMFAGLAHLPKDVVHYTGYGTIKQARKDFFRRVHLLYDLNVEPDDLAVLQSLLLMSFVYEKWNSKRHTWHWTGLALSLAQNMGLHRQADGLDTSAQSQRLRRRVWWSLYIRDRLIGLGLRRPIRIKDEDFDVSMLNVQDFDIGSFTISFNSSFEKNTLSQDTAVARTLALTCIELTKLCLCIGRVLASQYTTLGQRTQLTRTMMVAPKPAEERAQTVAVCGGELERWYQNLDAQVRNTAVGGNTNSVDGVEEIHWLLLHMLYQTTLIVLHRSLALQARSDGSDEADVQKLSRDKVRVAARVLTRSIHALHRGGKIHFLPTSAVPALLSASLGHMLNLTSADEDIRDLSIFHFNQTVQILHRLRGVYASADSAIAFLSLVVSKASLNGLIPENVLPVAGTSSATKPRDLGTSIQDAARSTNGSARMMASDNTDTMVINLPSQAMGDIDRGTTDTGAQRSVTSASTLSHSSVYTGMLAPSNQLRYGMLEAAPHAMAVASVSDALTQPGSGNTHSSFDHGFQDDMSLWMTDEQFLATGDSSTPGPFPLQYSFEYGLDASGLMEALYGGVGDDGLTLAKSPTALAFTSSVDLSSADVNRHVSPSYR